MADTSFTMYASKRVRRVRFSCLWYYIHYLSITLYTHSWSELSEPFSRHTLYLLHPFYRKFKNTFFQHLFFSFAASKRNKKLHIETFICLYFLVQGLGLLKNKAVWTPLKYFKKSKFLYHICEFNADCTSGRQILNTAFTRNIDNKHFVANMGSCK